MRWISIAGAVLMTACLSGCPQVEPAPENPPDAGIVEPEPQPLSVEELCTLHASASSNEGNLCVQGHVPSALDLPAGALAESCRPGTAVRRWADRLVAAHAAGKIEIDWGKARSCIATSRELRAKHSGLELLTSADWAAVRDGDCKTFFQGTVAEGSACEDDWECGPNLGCFTLEPSVAGSRSCAPYATVGQPCIAEGFYLCADGLFCTAEGTCEAERAAGAVCGDDAECASGLCGTDSGSCEEVPVKKLGEACSFTEECEGFGGQCITCRPDATGQQTCQLLGGEGAACSTWNDCAHDLGCTQGVCTTVGEGEACLVTVESVCGQGLTCIDTVSCSAITDQATCAATPTCAVQMDAGEWTCELAHGQCAVLPESGPCAGAGHCAAGRYCDSGTFTCLPRADVGQSCDESGSTAPQCLEALVCNEGVCTRECASDLDCANGEICFNTGDEDVPPICRPRATVDCALSAECGEGQYCLSPDDVCGGISASTACEANPSCDWNATEGCFAFVQCEVLDPNTCGSYPDDCAVQDASTCQDRVSCEVQTDEATCTTAGCHWNGTACGNACAAHDGDPTACAGASACSYDSAAGRCVSACGSMQSESACNALSTCEYSARRTCVNLASCGGLSESQCAQEERCQYASPQCVASPGAQSECRPKLAPGELVEGYCQVGQDFGVLTGYGISDACSSGACSIDAPGQAAVCLERTNYGCFGDNATGMMLSFSFLFGMVLLRRRTRS
ncbi:MAG: Dickkopf N-terminal cysteine-rich domain-containing protein [Myxococcaceae bacterium]